MVVSFWIYPIVLKVCWCVGMLLTVLLNDCITFLVFWSFFWTQIDRFHFRRRRHCCCLNLGCIVLMTFLLFKASFFGWNPLTMALLIVIESWLSGMILWSDLFVLTVFNLLLSSFRFIVVTSFIGSIAFNHGIASSATHGIELFYYNSSHHCFVHPDRNSFYFSESTNDHLFAKRTHNASKHEPVLYQEL